MSEALFAKLDEVLAEIRRQGRASIGAQASAESCLKEVRALQGGLEALASDLDANKLSVAPTASAASALSEQGLLALLPLLDAIDAAVRQGRATEQQHGRSSGWSSRLRSGLQRLNAKPASDTTPSLRQGLEMIQLEARSTLKRLGVEIDERTHVAVDPERHRVVDVRRDVGPARSVVEVLRPGYALFGVCVREADVIATR